MKAIASVAGALVVASFGGLFGEVANAKALDLHVVVPSVGHSFRTVEGGGYDNIIGAYYGGTPVPSFSANFADYDSIRYSIAAPDGQQFSYNWLPVIDRASLHVGLFFSYSGFTTWDVLPTTVSLRAPDGTVTRVGSSIETRAFDGGASFYIEGWLPFENTLPRFTELIIEADLTSLREPANRTVKFIPSFGSAVGLLTYSRGGIADPGPSLSLTQISTVPEPSHAMLFAVGFALLAIRRVRGAGE